MAYHAETLGYTGSPPGGEGLGIIHVLYFAGKVTVKVVRGFVIGKEGTRSLGCELVRGNRHNLPPNGTLWTSRLTRVKSVITSGVP